MAAQPATPSQRLTKASHQPKIRQSLHSPATPTDSTEGCQQPRPPAVRRYAPRHLLLRPYVLLCLHAPLTLAWPNYRWLAFGFVLSIAATLFLSTFWTVKSRLLQDFSASPTGQFVLFEDVFAPLRTVEGAALFSVRNTTYLLDGTQAIPVLPRTDFTFHELRRGTEHALHAFFPPNELPLPEQTFTQLFKEQCVTPLFCFQVFSSLLLCFDQHVLQGLLSTAMIVMVEAGLVFSRAATMRHFRSFRSSSRDVTLISQNEMNEIFKDMSAQNKPGSSVGGGSVRGPAAATVSSTALRPGDIIRLDSPGEIPCDLAVLTGSGAVNEAMLSGEATPLLKEALPVLESTTSTRLDMQRHRKHLLFGRTTLEQVTEPLYCRVLRTGFATEQGQLLCKMICAEDIKYDPEALHFILVLAVLALINSAVTFCWSKKSGYPLFVDLIVLFTSSIPFELPMEMSVVVHSVIRTLSRQQIFCLEPFRITMAGKVDVCCFDKTGTLTDARLEMKEVRHASEDARWVLQCCHGLMEVNGAVRGDPLDVAVLDYLKREARLCRYEVIAQFPFSSELRRHCTLVRFEGAAGGFFAMKGAPETVREFLRAVPEAYEDYKTYAAAGYRVLALAGKGVSERALAGDRRMLTQKVLEESLEFAGFVLFGSKLKNGAAATCKALMDSGHRVVMITGDNLLTATSVAGQLGITGEGVEGEEIARLLSLAGTAGPAESRGEEGNARREAVERLERISIFARAEPAHKEMIIKCLNQAGHHTLMVGDGTNDMGALKAADVGVALLEGPAVAARPQSALKADEIVVRPGDASVAAPFTIRSASLEPVQVIIRHGRASLVTTIQMYKILALNSVTTAFFLTFIDILGIKFSEAQMVAAGVMSAMAFGAITSSQSLAFIARERPVTTIFSRYVIYSLVGQVAVHVAAYGLFYWWLPSPAPATEFEPSLMNTALFALSCAQTVSTFATNYIGRPFRESLAENRLMVLSMLALSAFVVNIIFKVHGELNELVQAVSLDGHALFVAMVIVANVVLSWLAERLCFKHFMMARRQ